MRFLPANVLFVVDWIVLGRMPYKDLPGYDIHGMIESTRAGLEGPRFDLFISGHGETGTRADVKRYLAYLEDLYAAVRNGMLAGKTKKQLQNDIRLPAYSDLRMYEEWLPMNVAGVYDTLVDMSYFNQRSDLDRVLDETGYGAGWALQPSISYRLMGSLWNTAPHPQRTD